MIKFANPHMAFLFAGVPVLILLFLVYDSLRRRALSRIGDRKLIERMLLFYNPVTRTWKRIFLVLGYSLLVLALMRPQIGAKLEKVKREGIDIVFALDVSKSMLAEDLKPNRLANAKNEIRDFVRLSATDRFALVVFAGDAYIMCPLTIDYDAFLMFLNAVDVGIVADPGTDIARALGVAEKAFVEDVPRYKAIVLITDGENTADSDPIGVAKELAKKGIKVYTIGVGSPTGAPVPMKNSKGNVIGYKRDPVTGAIVTSRLDEDLLQRIAEITGGKYFAARPGAENIRSMLSEIRKMGKKEFETLVFTHYEEKFYYPLTLGILFLFAYWALPERSKKLKM